MGGGGGCGGSLSGTLQPLDQRQVAAAILLITIQVIDFERPLFSGDCVLMSV